MANNANAEIIKAKKLLDYYVKKTGERVNVIKDFWDFQTLSLIMNQKEIKELIDYYAEISKGRGTDIRWFYQNYDKLQDGLEHKKSDRQHIKELMKQSKERTAEWRQKQQKSN